MDDLKAFQYVSTYRIVQMIAQGGMGKVYLADQLGVAEQKVLDVVYATSRAKMITGLAIKNP